MSVSIEETVSVTIQKDPALVTAFMAWCIEYEVYKLAGGGTRRHYTGTYPGADKLAIEKFFQDWKKKR